MNNFHCFENIDRFVVSYLKDEKDYSSKMEEYFKENYSLYTGSEKDTSVCKFCNYKNTCINRIKEGYLEWKKN